MKKKDDKENIEIIVRMMKIINKPVPVDKLIKSKWRKNKLYTIYPTTIFKYENVGIDVDTVTLNNTNKIRSDLTKATTMKGRKEIMQFLINGYPMDYIKYHWTLSSDKYNI